MREGQVAIGFLAAIVFWVFLYGSVAHDPHLFS
ncbi:hypothetical protein ABIB56_000872 [Glaciihabitans sp. UYNi722]